MDHEDEDFDLDCPACGWHGDQLTDDVDQEYGRGGLTWWCPSCGEQVTEE